MQTTAATGEQRKRVAIYGGYSNVVRDLEKKLNANGFDVAAHFESLPARKDQRIRVPDGITAMLLMVDGCPTQAVPAVKEAAKAWGLPCVSITRQWAQSLRAMIQAGLINEMEMVKPPVFAAILRDAEPPIEVKPVAVTEVVTVPQPTKPTTQLNPPAPPALPDEARSAMRLLREEIAKCPTLSKVYFTRTPAGDIEVQYEILQPAWGML